MKSACVTRIVVSQLLLVVVLAAVFQLASAQAPSDYWVTVSLATPNEVLYSTIGHNLTAAFRAVWSHGDNAGQAIEDANVTVEVKTARGAVIDSFNATTDIEGLLSFNYSTQTPDILTFTPVKLFSQDGTEWNSTLRGENLYGLQSEPLSIYFDTFDVTLLTTETNTQGITRVSVNVTYLLVPEEGLTLPPSSSYLNQTFFPKIAHGVDVAINGVRALESTEPGVYSAEAPTLLPTAYVLIEVSQEGWSPNQEAFSFTHESNASIWVPATGLGAICVVASLVLYFVRVRKSKTISGSNGSLPIVGGVLLLATSVLSLYWGIVGVDSTTHGFSWLLLSIAGLISFAFGLLGSVMAWRHKNQALVLFTICLSMLANVGFVKFSLDAYQLATPWIMITLSFAISVISGLLVGNSDEQFHSETGRT